MHLFDAVLSVVCSRVCSRLCWASNFESEAEVLHSIVYIALLCWGKTIGIRLISLRPDIFVREFTALLCSKKR